MSHSHSPHRSWVQTESGEELSEWERYCAEEYEYLMAQEEREAEAAELADADDAADAAEADQDPLSLSAPEDALLSAARPLSLAKGGAQPFPLDAL